MQAIQLLTRQAVEADELVKRTRAMIDRSIGDYFIFEIDGNPVACVALHVYPDEHQGELASLFVSAPHENQGIGQKLIQFVEDRARAMGLTQLIALSTQAFTHFQSKAGFHACRPPFGATREVRPQRTQFQGARQASSGARIVRAIVPI